MFEVNTLVTLIVKEVRLEQVQDAFNGMTNVSQEQLELGCTIWRGIDSMGGRSVTPWGGAPKKNQYSYTEEVLDIETDRHGYPVECWNTYWVKEVEFTSATSGSSLRWVADRQPIEGEDGAPGTFSFTQGEAGYFGCYFNAFNEVVGSLS